MDHRGNEPETATIACFPNLADREAFLGQIRLWNRVEGLPTIQVSPLSDGTRVQVRTVPSAQRGLVRLIEAFGGVSSWTMPDRPAPPTPRPR